VPFNNVPPRVETVSTGVEVRPAVPDDADGIAEVHVASWRGAYKGLLPAAMLDALSVERRAKQWQEELAKANQTTWVAVQAERVVGFASVGGSRDADTGPGVGELYAIYVIPPAWGRSVGHALHEPAVTRLASEYNEAVLWVLDGNARARGFYERHGWVPDGAVKEEQRGAAVLNEVRYRRFLGPAVDV
jgi:ribosomal protein S18 acetylase RimI-like enzyme